MVMVNWKPYRPLDLFNDLDVKLMTKKYSHLEYIDAEMTEKGLVLSHNNTFLETIPMWMAVASKNMREQAIDSPTKNQLSMWMSMEAYSKLVHANKIIIPEKRCEKYEAKDQVKGFQVEDSELSWGSWDENSS